MTSSPGFISKAIKLTIRASVPLETPMACLLLQYAAIKDEVILAISEVCDSQSFALGPAVAEFEEKIAAYCNSKHAIGVSS